jgi:hypothetical protein
MNSTFYEFINMTHATAYKALKKEFVNKKIEKGAKVN